MLNASPSSFIIMSALAKIVCEPGWKWQKRERPMQNYDLFYVWSGEGTVELNDEPFAVGKGSCFLFRPGDHTSATHNPQKPLVLTYIHFDVADPVQHIPASYRKLTETMDFEYLLARYVRLYLDKPYGS
ncbi:AraC family transcriptional regulator, partial [Clostridium perfringens]